MPWILWRHLAFEVVKVLMLTASVIVVVVAFGAAIKPLADNSLGAGSVMKYVGLAMIPMLQFALPFAAGFAATIVMHRFANDNELVAMAASGLKHRVILAPLAMIGGVSVVLMLWLVHALVPQFWGLMRDTVAQDAAAVFVAAVDRGEALDAGDLTLYADRVEVEQAPADTGAVQRLRLTGVAAVQKAKGTSGSAEFLGESAVVDVHHRDGTTVMKLSMNNGTGFRASEGTVAYIPHAAPDAVEIGRASERDARSTSTIELMRLLSNLDGEVAMQDSVSKAANMLERVDSLQCAQQTLATTGTITLLDDVTRRRYQVQDAVLTGDNFSALNSSKPIRVSELDGTRPMRRANATTASLPVASGGQGNRVDLAVVAASAMDVAGSEPMPTRWPPRLRDLRLVECPSTQRSSSSIAELLAALDELSATAGANATQAASAAHTLRSRQHSIERDLRSNIFQRAALAVSAPLVLLLGGVLAAWRRDSLPLTIYLLAFLPAILNMVTIAGGQQVMRSEADGLGVLIMWSGNALLGVLLWFAYREWARH